MKNIEKHGEMSGINGSKVHTEIFDKIILKIKSSESRFENI